jgi:hypothetical protein
MFLRGLTSCGKELPTHVVALTASYTVYERKNWAVLYSIYVFDMPINDIIQHITPRSVTDTTSTVLVPLNA